jgi:hypothetical protein
MGVGGFWCRSMVFVWMKIRFFIYAMWMSMRFFVKIQFDVHNPRMATDRHQAPSYPLRMPDELKAKLAEAAAQEGRSLHAELLFRLSASFDTASKGLSMDKVSYLIAMFRDEIAEKDLEIGKLRVLIGELNANLRVLFTLLNEGLKMTEEDREYVESLLVKSTVDPETVDREIKAALEALSTSQARVQDTLRRL